MIHGSVKPCYEAWNILGQSHKGERIIISKYLTLTALPEAVLSVPGYPPYLQ